MGLGTAYESLCVAVTVHLNSGPKTLAGTCSMVCCSSKEEERLDGLDKDGGVRCLAKKDAFEPFQRHYAPAERAEPSFAGTLDEFAASRSEDKKLQRQLRNTVKKCGHCGKICAMVLSRRALPRQPSTPSLLPMGPCANRQPPTASHPQVQRVWVRPSGGDLVQPEYIYGIHLRGTKGRLPADHLDPVSKPGPALL